MHDHPSIQSKRGTTAKDTLSTRIPSKLCRAQSGSLELGRTPSMKSHDVLFKGRLINDHRKCDKYKTLEKGKHRFSV